MTEIEGAPEQPIHDQTGPAEGEPIHQPDAYEPSERQEGISPALRTEQVKGFINVLGEYKTSLNAFAESAVIPEDIKTHFESFTTGSELDQTDNAKVIYKWYVKKFGGAAKLLKEAVPEEKRTDLHLRVARSLVEYQQTISKVDRTDRQRVLNEQMQEMAQFLLNNSEYYKEVQGVFQKENLELNQSTWEKNEDILKVLSMATEADQEIALLPSGELEASVTDWIAKMAVEARSGITTEGGTFKRRKIYETPHYLDLLDKLKKMGKRRNGVGGVILYGPPGTGKTELIREKNRREGFDTKVINVHKYIGYGDLFGERTARIQSDPGVQLATKLNIIIDSTSKLSATEFGRNMTSLYEEIKDQDNPDVSLGEFLLPNVSIKEAGVMDLLAKDELDDADWDILRKAYIDKQQTRLARTNLPESQQERPEEIMRGEILLAMKKSKETGQPIRILLDEVDKAGPGSLGGLLTFLSQSPGETIEFGGVTEEIPSWFKVDATSNATELDSYLTDRFAGLQVDTPPAKDQLMIAAVRLSDNEGKIQLTAYEQEQLSAFFVHVLPRVNALLHQKGHPPISNRLIQELTSNLVDFTNMSRTDMPMSEALQSLVINNRFWKSDQDLSGKLQRLFTSEFSLITHDKPRPQGLRSRFQEPASATSPSSEISQPLLKTIAGLKETPSGSVEIEEIILDAAQQGTIALAHQEKLSVEAHNNGTTWRLDTGEIIKIQPGENGTKIEIISVRPGEPIHTLLSRTVPVSGKLEGASADGSMIVLSAPRKDAIQDAKQLTIIPTGQESESFRTIDVGDKSKVILDATGRFIGSLDQSGVLKTYSSDSAKQTGEAQGVDGFQFAPDGQIIIITNKGKETSVYATQTMEPVIEGTLKTQEGHAWNFVGNSVLAQIDTTEGTVAQSARYVA